MRLCGGSILYTLFIALMIFTTLCSFILASHYQSLEILRNEDGILEIIDLKSAVQLGLSSEFDEDEFVYTLNSPLKNKRTRRLKIKKEYWGLYDILQTSQLNSDKRLSALLGKANNSNNNYAIFLDDANKPLSVAGNTKIIGNCVLPKTGIRRAYIEGQSFNGTLPKVIDSKKAAYLKPSLSKSRSSYVESLVSNEFYIDSIVDSDQFFKDDNLSNSWHNKTVVISTNGLLHLKNRCITGKFIITSNDQIIIENCDLDGVIFIAPTINVLNQQDGNMQLFASDSIVIDRNSNLQYPSVLCLFNKNTSRELKVAIQIKNGSKISGTIALFPLNKTKLVNMKLEIDQSSEVIGEIISNGIVEHKGKTFGSIYCRGFILKTPSSIYSNHLLNAVVDRNSLEENFISADININSTNEIIKWLN